jgi:hypothetical protein
MDIGKAGSSFAMQAYQEGWKAALVAVQETATKLLAEVQQREGQTSPIRKSEKAGRRKPRRKAVTARGSAKEQVLDAVRHNPGRLGTQIASIVAGTVNKNTVRTQLRRLRLDGEIEQHEQRWYVKGVSRQAA